LGAVAEQYHQEGMQHGIYSNLEIQSIGTKCALVTLDWKMLRSDNSIIREWRQSYNIIDQDGKCTFYVSTFHLSINPVPASGHDRKFELLTMVSPLPPTAEVLEEF
jgi:hypothetical protein